MEAFTTTKILYGDKSMIPYVAEKIAWIRSRRILCCTGIACIHPLATLDSVN